MEGLALQPGGPTVTLSLATGGSLAVVGPGASGKSRLLRVLAGEERPAQGEARVMGTPWLSQPREFSRRANPQALASRGGRGRASIATEALLATRLWDVRSRPVSELSDSQVAACELLEPLTSGADLLLIDSALDRLDPWALRGTLDFMRGLRTSGAAVVASTHRPDLVAAMDLVVVLNGEQVRFAGSLPDLLHAATPHTLHVSTENAAGVRALVEPFTVNVEETERGLRLQAPEGQDLAARLLLEGYGDVRLVVVRPPTVEQALLGLV
jgi:ABC-type multidrug transport system ATPase subunit